MNSGQAFVWMDRFLDTSTSGPQYLRQPVIAQMVVDAIRRGVTLGHYRLDAYVVMANHVHLLIVPGIPVSRLLKSLKGYTAREANRCLGRTGEAFWQAESYDHWARDEREWARIKAYIEDNPVKAGLVKSAAGYQWSSATAGVETSLDAADTSVCATYGPPSLNGI
jgi:REP element-mobilizing transposase RayT